MSEDHHIVRDMAESLARVTARVLEEAAYMFTEPSDPEPQIADPKLMATIGFHGLRSGRILIASCDEFCTDLAANILGTETDDPVVEGSARSALGEIANIVAGVWSAEIFGSSTVCNVGIPSIEEVPAERFAESVKNGVRFALRDDEDRVVDVALFVDDGNE